MPARPPNLGPPNLVVRPVPAGGLIVFRLVASDQRDSDAFLNSFKSNAALGKAPRRRSPEQSYILIHQGVSVFERRYQAEAMASRFPLGDFVATLRLESGLGLCTARWGSKGHFSLWGEPLTLLRCVADIVRVDKKGMT